MLDKILRYAAALFGVVLLGSGFRWQFYPASAAEALGMPLLDGMARSTQVGDISAFFIGAGVFALAAIFTRNATLMLTPLALVLFAALFRTTAWAFHDAAFATEFIVPEIVMGVVFFLAWRSLNAPANP